MDHSTLYLIIACTIGFMMTWGVGANDLANVLSTAMGSNAISLRQAIVIAILFETAGAFFGGTGVTNTMRGGIIASNFFNTHPKILLEGMLAVLVAGMLWINLASYFGMPVSITNAIVGSVIGFGAVILGVHNVEWRQVSYIAISWISAPLIAAALAYGLFISIQKFIFAKPDPLKAAHRLIPVYLFLIGSVLSLLIVVKGLIHFGYAVPIKNMITLTIACGFLIMLAGKLVIQHIPETTFKDKSERNQYIERMFAVLMALTACAMVFAHGSNDVAVAVGPLTIIVSIAEHAKKAIPAHGYPAWITLLGVVGVISGLLMYGRKVIKTVGSGITTLTPSRAFAATLAAAIAVVASTSTGIPVSATQTLVGAVLGVGLARGIDALNLSVIRNIFISWIITLPAASLLSILFFYLFKWIA